MHIRCAACARTTRVWVGELDSGFTCAACGWQTSLDLAKSLGATPEELFRKSRGFAIEKGIDLASAFSVLLGILPIDEALSVHLDDRYDPGFDDAVKQGFMTVQQAIERGDRAVYASMLQQKHGLAMDRAFQVADNRMLVSDALALQSADDARDAAQRRGTRGVWNIVQIAVAFVIVGAVTVAVLRMKDRPAVFARGAAAIAKPFRARHAVSPDAPQPVSQPQENVAFKTDAEGRVTEVSGPDPKSVLFGLCRHTQFLPTLTPIAVAPAVPPSAGDRLGFVRDSGDPSAGRCIAIRRDSRTGRWFAGDGREPLEIQRAPSLPPGAATAPL